MTKPFLRVGIALFCAAIAASVAHRVLAQGPGCPCSIWPASVVPANPALTRRAADRDRREVPIGRGRVRHRHPFLQRRAEHRHARRPPVVGVGRAARRGDVHGRDRLGLAGGAAVARGRDHRQHDLRRVVSRRVRLLRVRQRVLRGNRRRRAAASRAAVRRRRTERRLQVRRQRIPGAGRFEQLLDRRRVPDRSRTGRHAAGRIVGLPADGATGVALSSSARAHLQRGDRPGDHQRLDVRDARHGRRASLRRRRLRRVHPDGDVRHDCRPAAADHLHRHRQRRPRRRAGSRRQRARRRLHLVVHDGRIRRRPQTTDRRADSRHLELVESIQPLLRRDPPRPKG